MSVTQEALQLIEKILRAGGIKPETMLLCGRNPERDLNTGFFKKAGNVVTSTSFEKMKPSQVSQKVLESLEVILKTKGNITSAFFQRWAHWGDKRIPDMEKMVELIRRYKIPIIILNPIAQKQAGEIGVKNPKLSTMVPEKELLEILRAGNYLTHTFEISKKLGNSRKQESMTPFRLFVAVRGDMKGRLDSMKRAHESIRI